MLALLLLPLLVAAGDGRLMDAIRIVESGGRDRAVGDFGRSVGPYQCGRAAWIEACEYGGVRWSYDKLVRSRPHAAQVVRWYAARYGATTPKEISKCWNVGPRWRTRARVAGEKYWQRVKKVLDRR
jgi:hypothetical protein